MDARSRGGPRVAPLFGDSLASLLPIVQENGSDSASFDNVLELLTLSGRSLPHALLMMVPEAGGRSSMAPELEAFYDYHASVMEPWDGPACIAFCDGRFAGAILDRNGLRPGRYTVTRSGMLVMASEAGALEIPASEVQSTGRLAPGRMLLIDLEEQRLVPDEEIKASLAAAHPYAAWLKRYRRALRDLPLAAAALPLHGPDLRRRQRECGYTDEDVNLIIGPMAATGEEPIGSMGTDTAAGDSVRAPPPAVRLLHAGLRAGDEPSPRCHPRSVRDVPRCHCRT